MTDLCRDFAITCGVWGGLFGFVIGFVSCAVLAAIMFKKAGL